MYSTLVPFENIVEAVKDQTGITNLRNLYPKLRRFIYRAQGEIGYGQSLILKRIAYCVSDGTILVDSEGNYKAKLPEDLIEIEAVGTCYEGLCPKDYKIQGNWLFLCKEIQEFSLVYYTFLCDGEGYPVIGQNHFEAVVSGIIFFLSQARYWNKEIGYTMYKELQNYYEDRIGEARGSDLMPTTKEEWAQIARQLHMSYRDILIYSPDEACYCCIPQSGNTQVIDPDTDNTDDMVYYWQYTDLTLDISEAPNIDQTFLDAQSSQNVQAFIDGFVVPYSAIGRIGFAITNVDEDYYQIIDVFESDITDVAFDKYYDSVNRVQIYISKEIYSHGNIYYKLILN